MIIYSILGNPIALARPRFSSHRKMVFDSQKLEKLNAGLIIRQQHGNLSLYDTAIHMDITFFMNMPESYKKHWNEMRGKPHIHSPDCDNLIKFVLDTCQSVILTNDSCVSSISARKIYDDNARTEFTITKLE